MSPSDVFEGGTPRTVDKVTVLALLDDLRKSIEADDSMEGAFLYAWSDEPGMYDIGGILRIGNSMGQGGVRLLWEPPR